MTFRALGRLHAATAEKAKFRGVIFDNGPVLPKYIQQLTGNVSKVLKLQRLQKKSAFQEMDWAIN